MTRKYSLLICLVLCITAAAGLAFAGETEKVLRVYCFHRPPYYIVHDGGTPTGFLVEVSRMAFQEAGIPHTFVEMPPKRILKNIEQTEFSCAIGWFKTKERESFAIFSEPIYQNRPTGVILHQSVVSLFPKKPALQQLMKSGLTLGVVKGFSYGDVIDRIINELHPVTYSVGSKPENLLKMMVKKRVDYVFMAPEEAMYLLQKKSSLASGLVLVDIADAPPGDFRYLMFSKGVPLTVVERVNSAIRQVKKTQEYANLISFSPPAPEKEKK